MKIVLRILGGIVAVLILTLIVLRVHGYPPRNNHPGLWLTGDLVKTPVTDWSFMEQYQTIEIQTNTWYMIPHSVTATCASYNGQLYLTSNYPAGRKYPEGRSWNRNIARDPRVRLKIGDKLYDVVVKYLVTDPTEEEVVSAAKVKKYPPYGNFIAPNRKPAPGTQVILLRVVSA